MQLDQKTSLVWRVSNCYDVAVSRGRHLRTCEQQWIRCQRCQRSPYAVPVLKLATCLDADHRPKHIVFDNINY